MVKRIIFAVVTVMVCAAVFIGVFRAFPDYSFTAPDGVTVGYTEKDMSDAADIIGTSEKELKKQCSDNNVVLLALNKDNTVQVRLSKYQTAASKKAVGINDISDEILSDDMKKNGYEKIAIGNTVFLVTSEKLTDKGGEYVSKQYFTVRNGYIYQISSYVSNGADGKVAEDIIKNIEIKRDAVYSTGQKITVALIISAVIIVVEIMAFGIIKDIRKTDEQA